MSNEILYTITNAEGRIVATGTDTKEMWRTVIQVRHGKQGGDDLLRMATEMEMMVKGWSVQEYITVEDAVMKIGVGILKVDVAGIGKPENRTSLKDGLRLAADIVAGMKGSDSKNLG